MSDERLAEIAGGFVTPPSNGELHAHVYENARHSQDSPEWYTPKPFADAAREVFGGTIDLDPASCAEANEIISATDYYTELMNGLVLPWRGSVFVNPPGGDDKDGDALVPQFWRKLLIERDVSMREAIWIGYSIEQLQTLQNVCAFEGPLFTADAICVPRKRIAFVENAAKREQRIAKLIAAGKKPNTKSSPSHANYIAYIGKKWNLFQRVFEQFGECI